MVTLRNWKVQMRSVRTAGSKLRRLKLRRLKMRRMEMKTKTTNRFSRTLTSTLILLALIASTFVPALAQTRRRRPVLRRRAPVRKVVTPVTPVTPAAPATVYYNVNAGQIIRVRMNQNISSETARVGDEFTTTV